MTKLPPLQAISRQLALAGVVAACTLAAIPVHAASSFPDSPLMTGGEGIPPNILLILDDSGSMNFIKMPDDASVASQSYSGVQRGLNDTPSDRSYVNNTIYYNPTKTYRPWRTSSTDLNARLANANVSSASSSTVSANTSAGTTDLRGNADGIFYVPKAGVANPGTDANNFDRYWISSAGQVVVAGSPQNVAGFPKGPLNSSMDPYTQRSFTITIGKDTSLLRATTSGGGKGVQLNLVDPWSNTVCTSSDGNNGESCAVSNPAAGTWTVQVFRDNSATFSNVSLTAVTAGVQPQTPTGRSQADEIQNYANWYAYARTRSKTAKAGASEAFGTLSSRYRVGFDTIWNRGGSGGNVDGSSPNYPIPYATSDGQFTGTNRDTFYSRLQGAGANDGTPLKGALQRAARYFATDDPWKDSSGSTLTCRHNYSILTTDGYWNSNSGYSAIGNADLGSTYGDAWSDTLADVAFNYWKNDLRPDMTDNVRTSPADPAKWQHMVTFGVSIGLKGTLDPNSPPPNPWSVNPNLTEDARRIDDLWHATLNGRGKFVVASDPDSFASALTSALAAINSRTASGSNVASSSTKTDSSTLTFIAGFTSGSWIGDLVAAPFNAALTGVSDTPLWRLSKTFAAGGVNQNFASRRVLTTDSDGSAAQFTSSMARVAVFARSTGTDAVTAADNIDYLRGTKTKEIGQTNGTLRQRSYPIGDIVDSAPAYSTDTNTVYVGSNDGMMHGINAANGTVLFSYVPAGLDFAAMASLSSTSYVHRYFVDGQIDVSKKSADLGITRNILVGALGRGGKGVFALNVSSPSSMGTNDVLWDRTFKAGATGGVSDDDMGYVLGPVRIRKVQNGKMYAFVPNGVESVNGGSVLFAYELSASGAIVSTTKLSTGVTGGNGLMNLGLADLNGDGKIETVYGADLKGYVWKWDVSGSALPSVATKLFQAVDGSGNVQPITGGLGLARDNNGIVFIGFGTGRYMASSDVPGNPGYTVQTQSLYGIIDSGTLTTRAELQQRTIPFIGTDSQGRPARGFENYAPLPTEKKGWYVDLGVPAASASGERVVTSPTVFNSAMFLSSIIPAAGSDCSGALGSGYINILNIFTGTSPRENSYFTDTKRLSGSNGATGVIGSVNIGGGMPTQVNVTSNLVTAGDGTGTGSDGDGGHSGTGGGGHGGGGGVGQPLRVNWREIVPLN